MADALCGPSSSLDAFKKHTSVDRTLQQDRFSASQASAEGFRSSRAIVGALDAEFEAFQSDHPLQLKEIGYGTLFPHKPANFVELNHLQTEIPPWVAEFQSLQIANARAGFELQPQSQELLSVQPDFQDLRGQHAQLSHFLYNKQQIPSDSHHNNNHIQSRYHPQSNLSTDIEKGYDPRIDEAVESEAFERAFDAAAAANQESFDKEEHVQREITGYDQKNLTNDNADALFKEKKDLPFYQPIGSDRIIDEVRKKKQQQVGENNEDELARTAGELLDNIKHEHSQKFKDSNFLSLMRQIRDREVRIEGDKVVEAEQPLHPGGVFYPDETQNQDKSHFANIEAEDLNFDTRFQDDMYSIFSNPNDLMREAVKPKSSRNYLNFDRRTEQFDPAKIAMMSGVIDY